LETNSQEPSQHLAAIRSLLERYVAAYERYVEASSASKVVYEKQAEAYLDYLRQHREQQRKGMRLAKLVLLGLGFLAIAIGIVLIFVRSAR
jgi:hypothetical protein